MSKKIFSEAERLAVWSIHGQKCYICTRSVDLASTHIDHIIPEALAAHPQRLSALLVAFGKPLDFELNAPHNWLPACAGCNLGKRDTEFEPTPLVQLQLQRAKQKAVEVTQAIEKALSDKSISTAVSRLLAAHESGQLSEWALRRGKQSWLKELQQSLEPIAKFIQATRSSDSLTTPIRLTPVLEVLLEQDGVLLVQGPYGVGGRPSTDSCDPSWICGTCGMVTGWSGARCVLCGQLSDD